MDPIILASIAAGITALVGISAAIGQYQKILAKNREIEALRRSLGQYSDSYSFEECDRRMISECRKTLDRFLQGRKFSEVIAGQSDAERIETTRRLAAEIARSMRVDISELHVETLSGLTLGSEIVDNRDRIILYLNSDLLSADPDRMVSVILHELRHAVQDSALRRDIWGFSDERKAQWLIGNQSYITASSQADYVAYVMQIVENDANLFADTVLKAKKTNL